MLNTSQAAASHHGDVPSIRERVRGLLDAGVLAVDESLARDVLADAVPFGEAVACRHPNEAVAAAAQLGYPVVVKGLSPQLLHKSEHGLVVTGCAGPDAVRAASERVLAALAHANVDGPRIVSVQRQLQGIELAIGVRQDELGPVCMVAAGGTLIELIGDRALGMAPLDRQHATAMIDSLRMRPLLDGFRDRPGGDVEALVDLLLAISELAVAVPEIAELDLNPVFVDERGCAVADARAILTAAPVAGVADDQASPAALHALFEPRSIAVIGASRDERKPGGLILKYLRKHGYSGQLVAINPKSLGLPDVETYPTLADVPHAIDLACIAVPVGHVESVVRACVACNVPAGIIFSAGFAEAGDAGRRAQERVLAAADGRFRFVGPNSIGVASPGQQMFATFGMALEADDISVGSVGLLSQSGAIATSLISRGAEFNLGFSHWISGGNEADLGLAAYLAYLVEDPQTKVVCLFLEAVRRPRAFAAASERALAAGKPIIALKTGRSEAGRRAAASHTGALTGSHAAYEAFLEDIGVLQVADLPSLFYAAQGLTVAGPAAGPRIGIISMSGGACSVLADACADMGLEVPRLPPETQRALADLLPSFGAVRNPVDVTAEGIRNPDLVHKTLDLVRNSGAVDLVLVQLSTNADPAARDMAEDLLVARGESGAPFLVGRLGSPSLAPQAMKTYAAGGLHVFSWPDQLVAAAKACVEYGRLLGRYRDRGPRRGPATHDPAGAGNPSGR